MKDINATILIDLRPSEEEIIKNLQKDARWGIKKAEREGLIVEQSDKKRDWEEFYEIYSKTLKNQNLNPESLNYLQKNTKVFFVCKKNKKIIAGAGIGFFDEFSKKIPRLFFNASLSEFRKYQPNNLLYWNCILWAKKQGYKKFDLGGWQINAKGNLQGINKFKEKWGKIVYYQKNYPFHKAIGRKLIKNSDFFLEFE